MDRFLKTLAPVVVFAAAAAAAVATMTGAGDASPHAAARAADPSAAAPAPDLLFISERFEEQKRNAREEELPAQF